MHIIVCVDDRMGMLFNHRRQSRDRVLTEYLLKRAEGHTLYMSPFSEKLLGAKSGTTVSPDFLREAQPGDYCFVEDQPLSPWEDAMESLILCRWNRAYPGDFFLDLDLKNWQKAEACEFPGSSHDKITVETYLKRKGGAAE